MLPFRPLFRNPHLQTIASHFWRRPPEDVRFPVERRLFRTGADVQVLVEMQRPEGAALGQVVMVHGLEGSGASSYMRGLSGAALQAGFRSHRFHMRTCGGTERLCGTLYHAGLTSDLRAVLGELAAEDPSPIALVGFSLGGNVVVKLAGELGEAANSLLCAVCAVSASLDLAASSRRMELWDDRIYQSRFVKRMRRRLCATGRYAPGDFAGLDSIRAIDDRITAPAFGFASAEDYYRTQSAVRLVEGIRVPVLLIHAKDDPVVPFESLDTPAVRANPAIDVLATEHGGHLGFLGRRPHRFWLDAAIMEWIAGQALRKRTGTRQFIE